MRCFFKSLVLFAFLFIHLQTKGQEKLDFDISKSCSVYGEKIGGSIYGFNSTKEAITIVDDIVKLVGLKRKFKIMSGNVPNAVAVIKPIPGGHDRFIIYSQSFISNLKAESNTYWSAIGVLAHEMGHHFNGHTLLNGGSRPPTELEADEFAGFVLGKLGATIKEAQSMFNNKLMYQEFDSDSHPATSARLEAIAVGWENGREKEKPKRTTNDEVSERIENKKTNSNTTSLCNRAINILDGNVNKDFEGSLQILIDATKLNNCYSRQHELFESELAFWYFNGHNRAPEDLNESYYWAKRAANMGDRRGMFFVGVLLLSPNDTWVSRGRRVVPYNKSQGVRLLKQSAKFGFGPAEQMLRDLGEY
jgi:hypothetical protein